MHEEARAYGLPPSPTADPSEPHALAVPLEIQTELGRLSFLSTVTVFGSPVDVTLSEVALEVFYPADAATNERVRAGKGE